MRDWILLSYALQCTLPFLQSTVLAIKQLISRLIYISVQLISFFVFLFWIIQNKDNTIMRVSLVWLNASGMMSHKVRWYCDILIDFALRISASEHFSNYCFNKINHLYRTVTLITYTVTCETVSRENNYLDHLLKFSWRNQ